MVVGATHGSPDNGRARGSPPEPAFARREAHKRNDNRTRRASRRVRKQKNKQNRRRGGGYVGEPGVPPR